ncbi:MAG: glycosyltransferase [Kineothrix sp.]|nr:glycosyltransferase [Kineothrix sp.]
MNIAILIQTLGGGGAERVAQIIGDYYVNRGNNVYYFLGHTSVKPVYPVKGQIVDTGIKGCLSNNVFGDIQALGKLFLASLQMRKWKRRYQIDVAVSFMEEFNYLNILSKGREKVITRVCTILSQEGEWVNLFFRKDIVHFFYPKSDRIVVMSEYAKRDMYCNFNIPMNKMVKIPNPVVTGNTQESSMGLEYGDKVIITVGRLAPEKQQERIIRAFSYVAASEKDARLLILGTGPNEGYLKNIAYKHKVKENVIFAGFKSDVAHYLKNSRIFVLASRLEGFPNGMIEAMANGLPVVTTDAPGGCGEIVGKKREAGACEDIEYCPYGIMTPHISGQIRAGGELTREERLLGQAMLELLRNEELCERYSKRSMKRAAMYDVEKIMEIWNRLLQT